MLDDRPRSASASATATRCWARSACASVPRARSWRSSAPAAAARARCCGWSPAWRPRARAASCSTAARSRRPLAQGRHGVPGAAPDALAAGDSTMSRSACRATCPRASARRRGRRSSSGGSASRASPTPCRRLSRAAWRSGRRSPAPWSPARRPAAGRAVQRRRRADPPVAAGGAAAACGSEDRPTCSWSRTISTRRCSWPIGWSCWAASRAAIRLDLTVPLPRPRPRDGVALGRLRERLFAELPHGPADLAPAA